MEPLQQGDADNRISGTESWHELHAEVDPSQLLDQTSALHASSCQNEVPFGREGQLCILVDDLSRTDRFESLQLDFQDSRLSPALTLIPQGKTVIFSESTLLHQTDSEFVPLRGLPDLSIASGRDPHVSDLDVESSFPSISHEQASLSQHPLGVTAAIPDDFSSYCSLSQHSLSPSTHCQATQVDDDDEDEQKSGLNHRSKRQMEGVEHTDADLEARETVLCAFSDGAPAHPMLEKDVGVISSNVLSYVAETFNQTEALIQQNQSKQADLADQNADNSSTEEPKSRSSNSREQPQGGSSSSFFQKITSQKPMISNITVRFSSMQSDCTNDHSQKLLLSSSHTDNIISSLAKTNQSESKDTPGLQRLLWGTGSQTAADGSFLTSQPVSQSTPAVLLSRPAPVMSKLSPIYSHQDTMATAQTSSTQASQLPPLDLSTTDPQTISEVPNAISSELVGPHSESNVLSDNTKAPSTGLCVPSFVNKDTTTCHPLNTDSLSDPSGREFMNHSTALFARRVRSLPTLSYIQKVDAWKTNQSSSGSFYNNLASQQVDCLTPKKKVDDLVSNLQQCNSGTTELKSDTPLVAQASQPAMASSSQPGSGSLKPGDVVWTAGGGAPPSGSPFGHSHSHSSLSTVMTTIQQDGAQLNPQLPLTSSEGCSPYLRELSLLPEGVSEQKPADQLAAGSAKPSALLNLGQFSDSSNLNIVSALSSSQGSVQGDQSVRASVGAASSVMSLEVDNYAPYWNSRPGSPPCSFELNIEDRIPLYLRNLGIDQSPSTILNPFTPRGPIREPVFSPTELCTIKGSVGTPTKSAQPSEGGSPQKETFSSFSLLSADSVNSVTRRVAVQKLDRPASPGTVRMVRCQAAAAPDPHTPPHHFSTSEESDAPLREGSYGLPAQLSPESFLHPPTWQKPKEKDSSLVGSSTLQEIRCLLGRAEVLVSDRSSLASSPKSCCYSESDASFQSLRQNTQAYLNESSLSAGGNISMVLPCSSSDSALKDNSSSTGGPLQLSNRIDCMTTEANASSLVSEKNLKSRNLRVAPRRTEPEGCNASDPDKVVPVVLSVVQGSASSTPDDHQQSQESTENADINSSQTSSTHSQVEAELGVLSDSSSESSLAARVTKLLQSESPVSVVTSRPTTTDPEESRAREWIMMKVSGRQCEALELNMEDRKRIEEIKKELLLHTKHTKSQRSSDSESSVQSNVYANPESTVGFAAVRSAQNHLSEKLQRATQNLLDSTAPYTPIHHNLEARVHQIALREGLNPPAPLTSITIATSRHTPSPDTAIPGLPSLDMNTVLQTERTCSPTSTSLISADEERRKEMLQSGREVDIEKRGTASEETNRKNKVEQETNQESGKNSQSVVKDVAHINITDKKAVPSNLELSSVPPHKPHLSHIHFTLSPKRQQSTSQRIHSPARDVSSPTDRLLTQSNLEKVQPPVSSSCKVQHALVTSETSIAKERHVGQGQYSRRGGYSQLSSRCQQTVIPPQKLVDSTRLLSVQTAAIPTLLPYKPHGSSELFYMPQTDPELSPVCSDSTMESSHPGSDDAVPPRFTTEILGFRELQDNNITPKHKEGIYSKRAKMNKDSTAFAKGLIDSKVSVYTQRGSNGSHYQFSISSTSDGRDKWAVDHEEQAQCEEEEFVPLPMEADYSTDDLQQLSHAMQKHNVVPKTLPSSIKHNSGEEQALRTQELGLEISSSLDQLWRRFSERWNLQETQPTNEGETSLLERLERLSRLLLSTTPSHTPAKQARSQEQKSQSRRREYEPKRPQGKDTSWSREDKDKTGVGGTPKAAWEDDPSRTNQALEEEEQENAYRCPAERDESASVSVETSSSHSTIDMQRLLRAFGPHRVNSRSADVKRGQSQKTSGSLLKLHNTINKQRRGHDSGVSEQCRTSGATGLISTDESTASADSLSSSSTYTLPSERGATSTISTKKPKVKLVNRGIQAGDLEIVVNGTRKHTRDVGTIFPSPGNTKDSKVLPSAKTELQAAPTLSTTALVQFHRVGRRDGVSWFVSTDELKQDARKENEPQSEGVQAVSQAWFEPYSRTQPWREPMREPLRERHIQLEQEKSLESKAPLETDIRNASALVRLSLQEALELNRPGFVSRSRERMKRLCLLAEERKMQVVFSKEREALFNRPLPQPTAAPPPMPSKRVIPVKEMVQRSKRIYAQLPEVQKRKLEEKRKAAYRSYRLSAQLFNKKVTNRVLGRRAPWQ